jgi:hypothetical protein
VAGREEYVAGLDVTMHDAYRMGIRERVRYLPGNTHRLPNRKLMFPAEPFLERLLGNERHYVEQRSTGLARIEEGEDVRMVEPGGELDLL